LRAYCGDAEKLRNLWQDIYLTRLSGADRETRTLLDESIGRPKAHSIALLAQSMSGSPGTASSMGLPSPVLSRARAGSGGGREIHHRRAFSDPDLDLFSLASNTTGTTSSLASGASVSGPPSPPHPAQRPATVDGDDGEGDGGGGGGGVDSQTSDEVVAYARGLLEATTDGSRPSLDSVRRAVAHKFGADACYEARSALRKLAADVASAPQR
jgi:hypothetical protein